MADEQWRQKIQEIKKVQDETKKAALEATNKLIERGDKLDDLLEKTEGLVTESAKFKRTAKEKFDPGCCDCLFNFEWPSFWSAPEKNTEKTSLRPRKTTPEEGKQAIEDLYSGNYSIQ